MSRSNAFVILIVVVLLVAGGIVAYAIFSGDTSTPPSGIVQESTGRPAPLASAGVQSAAQQSKELLTLLRSLQTIELDSTLFVSPIYQSLTDFTVVVAGQPQGRHNPFAPLRAGEVFNDGPTPASSDSTDINSDPASSTTTKAIGTPPAGF